MGYLDRLEDRQFQAGLKRRAVFGTGMGIILAGVSLFREHFVAFSSAELWHRLWYVGWAMVVVALVLPQAFTWPERLWMAIAQKIGHLIFGIVLGLAYYLVVSPVGAFVRWKNGAAPIYRWKDRTGFAPEGWIAKETPPPGRYVAKERIRRAFILRHPFAVFGYFVSRGQLFFLPVLIVLLLLGLILFFVQSSSLAPFIYTLF